MLRDVMPTRTVLAALLGIALLAGGAASAAEVPQTQLKPAKLERGPDPTVVHLDGRTVRDGEVAIEVEAGQVRLLGKAGDDYVVGTAGRDGIGRFRVWRYEADGSRTLLLRDVSIWELVLSDDGAQIVSPALVDNTHSRLRVYDAADGSVETSRRFRGFALVLDADAGRVLVGASMPERTFVWTWADDAVERVNDRLGYEGDLGTDRLAAYTDDPYNGGCTVVTTVTAPDARLWRSCDERVDTFAPGGTRLATVPILSDGIGPGEVWLRRTGGRLLADYTTGWFGLISWESDRSLLLEANGSEKAALVRCELADCERASDLRPTPEYRAAIRAARS